MTPVDEQNGETIGEVSRTLRRLEISMDRHQQDTQRRFGDLANSMQVALSPISEFRVHIDNARKDIDLLWSDYRKAESDHVTQIDALKERQRLMELRAAAVSGGVAVIMFIIKTWIVK